MSTPLRIPGTGPSAVPLLQSPKTKSFSTLSSLSFISNTEFRSFVSMKATGPLTAAVSFPRRALTVTAVSTNTTRASSEGSMNKNNKRARLPTIQPGDRIDYRNITLLSRFVSEQGKILTRKVNRLSAKQQRMIAKAIKQARILSLLPFVNTDSTYYQPEEFPRAPQNYRSRRR